MRIVFSLILCFGLLLNSAFAADIPNPGNFIKAGLTGKLNTPNLINAIDGSLGNGLVTILQLLYTVGVTVAVCVFAYMGIQILIASPQQKAQLKASIFPYFVGLLLFVAGVPIAILIINIIIQFF